MIGIGRIDGRGGSLVAGGPGGLADGRARPGAGGGSGTGSPGRSPRTGSPRRPGRRSAACSSRASRWPTSRPGPTSYRRDHPESGPWHYVNVPITEPKFDPKFVPKEGCVVTKIDEFRKVLADPDAPREDRRQGPEVPGPLRPGHAPAGPRRPPRRPGRQRPPGPVLRPGVEPAPGLGLGPPRARRPRRGGLGRPPVEDDHPRAGRRLVQGRAGRLGQREPGHRPGGLPEPGRRRRAAEAGPSSASPTRTPTSRGRAPGRRRPASGSPGS